MSLLFELYEELRNTDKYVIDYITYNKCKNYKKVESFLFSQNYKNFTKQFFELKKNLSY